MMYWLGISGGLLLGGAAGYVLRYLHEMHWAGGYFRGYENKGR